jgi:hypothetical protein
LFAGFAVSAALAGLLAARPSFRVSGVELGEEDAASTSRRVEVGTSAALFDSLNVRLLGSWPFGSARAVAVDAERELAFVGSGAGVYVVDVSAPEEPEKLSEAMHFRELIQDLEYEPTSRRLYVLTSYTLEVWDVSDPSAPARLGSTNLDGAGSDLQVTGAYAYVVTLGSGLQVYSVLDPANPHLVGHCWFSTYAYGVAVSGSYAYVADAESGIRVISVLDPAHPIQVAVCESLTAGTPRLVVNGSYVYAVYDYELWVVDVSNPSFPQTSAVLGNENSYYSDIMVRNGCLLASGSNGLTVFDISRPAHPFVALAAVTGSGRLASAGDYVYIAAGSAGLDVVYVESPTNGLHQVGLWPGQAPCLDTKIQGDLAYVAAAESGLCIVSIRDPRNPFLVGTCLTPGPASKVALYDRYACVATEDSGLRVIDVADSANPHEVGSIVPSGPVWDVAVFDHYALAATYGAGLRVIDLADPANPAEVGSCLPGGLLSRVVAASGFAYVGVEGDTALYAIDISDPANPQVVGADATPSGRPAGLAFDNGYVYLSDWTALRIVDATVPSQLVPVARYDITGSNNIQGLALASGRAFLACQDPSLVVLDVSNPEAIQELGRWNGGNYSVSVAVSGNYAWVGTEYNSGLAVVDVSNPVNSVTQVGQFPVPSRAYDVAVADDYAFVADYTAGLRVIDVLNPAAPEEIGWLDTPGRAYAVKLSGNYAYLADYSGGLRVVDVSDPVNPREAGFCVTSRKPYALALGGHNAYMACRTYGVRVVDITDPSNPREALAYDTHSAEDLAVQDQYLYVADDDHGLLILNTSNPETLTLAGSYDAGSPHVISVAVGGNYAYLGYAQYKVEVVDISDTANLRLVATVSLPDDANRLTLAGSRLFVGDKLGGLRVLDVSDTANVREVGHYDTESQAWGVSVSGRRVFLADYYDGLQIFGLLTEDVAESGPVLPSRFSARLLGSPARGRIQLNLTLPVARDVSLQLFDISGREVSSWHLNQLKAGANTLSLPCAGRASGVYFLRAKSGSEDQRLKVVLAD